MVKKLQQFLLVLSCLLLVTEPVLGFLPPQKASTAREISSLGRTRPAERIGSRLFGWGFPTELVAEMQIYVTSPEPIHSLFSIATFGPQPFWLLMILFPKAGITKKLMGGLGKYI